MDAKKQTITPHMIDEVPKFKAFADGYFCSGSDALQGYTNV